MDFSNLLEANELIKTTPVKGKEYAEVHERIKVFRYLFPHGTIKTEIVSLEGKKIIMRAEAYDGDVLLGTGHAYEMEGSSFINSTSYIENCETSAVGRALAMIGIGINMGMASYEEVGNAILQQGEQLATSTQKKKFLEECKIRNIDYNEIFKKLGIEGKMTFGQYKQAMEMVKNG